MKRFTRSAYRSSRGAERKREIDVEFIVSPKCVVCGKSIERTVQRNRMEPMTRFLKRKVCSKECLPEFRRMSVTSYWARTNRKKPDSFCTKCNKKIQQSCIHHTMMCHECLVKSGWYKENYIVSLLPFIRNKQLSTCQTIYPLLLFAGSCYYK